jgi:hypothetical protein
MRRSLTLLALVGATACFDSRGGPRSVQKATSTPAFERTWDGLIEASNPAEAAAVAKRSKAAADAAKFAEAEEAGSDQAYLAYLRAFPEGRSRGKAIDAARALAEKEADDKARLLAYERLVEAAPEASLQIPKEAALLLVGPPGMRIKDLLAMKESGLGEEVVTAKIATENVPYRSFSIEELGQLKALGLPDAMVKAMIESTARALREKRDEQERESLKREIAELKKLVAAKGAGAGEGATVQTKDGPLDQAACIAKRLAAMKICEQMPWPGSTVCSSTAQANFPCK